MTLIRRAPTAADLLSIQDLDILTLRYIYEEEKMSIWEINLMRFCIDLYANKIREKQERKAKRLIILPGDEETGLTPEEDALRTMAVRLHAKETNTIPFVIKRSIMMSKLGMFNWRKKHDVPGAHNKADWEKTQIMYAKYKEQNKEQEDMGEKK